MKKGIKRAFIVVGAVLGLLIVFGVVFVIKMGTEAGKMSPMETQEVAEGVYALRDGNVNLFLLKHEEAVIAIDAGNSEGGVQHGLDDLGIDPEKVLAVFLTHTDNDHIGGLRLFSKATVYISHAEEQMINGQTARFWIMKNKLNYPYECIEDGQIITLPGFTVRGILTPGHTPGSMCYVVNDDYLFTGDSMSLQQGKANLFNEAFNMDSDMQRVSMKKEMNLPDIKYVFTGHYGFTDDYQNAFADWLQ